MPVLSTFQPGPSVDPATALNVFTSLQESRKRNELLEQQTQNVAQQMAFEKELQPTKKATQIAQLGAAENQLKGARIAADQAVLQQDRLKRLQDSWDPVAFQAEFDAIKDVANVSTRRSDLTALKAKYGKYMDVPDAQAFIATQIADYGEALEGEFQQEISAGESEWHGDQVSAKASAPGYKVSQKTNPWTPESSPLWTVTKEPDPILDGAASTSLRIAMMKGPEAIEKALDDPAVRTMLGVPSSATSRMFQDVQSMMLLKQKLATEIANKESEVEIKEDTEDAVAFTNDFFATSASSDVDVQKITRGIQLLDEGVRTGFGASAVQKGLQIAAAFRIDVGDLAESEELFTILGDQVMARIAQTKGAVSNKEMELFEQYSAGPGKSPEGNKKILEYALAAAKRLQVMSAAGLKMKAEGKSARHIRDELLRIRNSSPLGFDGGGEDPMDAELKRRGL
jgi:hypothetical protein